MFASSGPGHTAASSSDHPAAATESILHLTPRLASLDSVGAFSWAGYSTSTNLRPARVCAPRGVPIAPSGIRLFRWNPQGRGRISVTLGGTARQARSARSPTARSPRLRLAARDRLRRRCNRRLVYLVSRIRRRHGRLLEESASRTLARAAVSPVRRPRGLTQPDARGIVAGARRREVGGT